MSNDQDTQVGQADEALMGLADKFGEAVLAQAVTTRMEKTKQAHIAALDHVNAVANLFDLHLFKKDAEVKLSFAEGRKDLHHAASIISITDANGEKHEMSFSTSSNSETITTIYTDEGGHTQIKEHSPEEAGLALGQKFAQIAASDLKGFEFNPRDSKVGLEFAAELTDIVKTEVDKYITEEILKKGMQPLNRAIANAATALRARGLQLSVRGEADASKGEINSTITVLDQDKTEIYRATATLKVDGKTSLTRYDIGHSIDTKDMAGLITALSQNMGDALSDVLNPYEEPSPKGSPASDTLDAGADDTVEEDPDALDEVPRIGAPDEFGESAPATDQPKGGTDAEAPSHDDPIATTFQKIRDIVRASKDPDGDTPQIEDDAVIDPEDTPHKARKASIDEDVLGDDAPKSLVTPEPEENSDDPFYEPGDGPKIGAPDDDDIRSLEALLADMAPTELSQESDRIPADETPSANDILASLGPTEDEILPPLSEGDEVSIDLIESGADQIIAYFEERANIDSNAPMKTSSSQALNLINMITRAFKDMSEAVKTHQKAVFKDLRLIGKRIDVFDALDVKYANNNSVMSVLRDARKARKLETANLGADQRGDAPQTVRRSAFSVLREAVEEAKAKNQQPETAPSDDDVLAEIDDLETALKKYASEPDLPDLNDRNIGDDEIDLLQLNENAIIGYFTRQLEIDPDSLDDDDTAHDLVMRIEDIFEDQIERHLAQDNLEAADELRQKRTKTFGALEEEHGLNSSIQKAFTALAFLRAQRSAEQTAEQDRGLDLER